MEIIATGLPEVLILQPRVFADSRGYFYESYNHKTFMDAVGYEVGFVQDNHSRSGRGVIRGLHFQRSPRAQGKLVRVTRGRAFDVAVDIRPDSPRFGRWTSVELSADNFRQLWIPAGFAHGFLALADDTQMQYKATDYYSSSHEGCIIWSDPAIGIRWPVPDGHEPILSSKDAVAPRLAALQQS